MDPLEPIRRSLASEITAGAGRLLRGLIPYNSPTKLFERGKLFTETIRPGAFSRALAGRRDVIATFNHNPDRMLGRSSSGTLRLTDTPEGLRYEVDLPDCAADVREMLARGDLRGSSFTAFPAQGGETWGGTPKALTRDLTDLELVELGPVVSPAYSASEADVRAAAPLPPAPIRLAGALVKLMERA
jgi:HK97 family phage prohead protease